MDFSKDVLFFQYRCPEPLRKEKNRTYQKGKDTLETNETIISYTTIQDKNMLYMDSKMKNKTIPKQNVMKCLPWSSEFISFETSSV